jgi:hypothetical protein
MSSDNVEVRSILSALFLKWRTVVESFFSQEVGSAYIWNAEEWRDSAEVRSSYYQPLVPKVESGFDVQCEAVGNAL